MLEANKFWFYSLLCSIVLGFLELYSNKREVVRVGENKFKVQMAVRRSGKRLKRRLVADFADLLIPGYVTGWINTGQGVVGMAR